MGQCLYSQHPIKNEERKNIVSNGSRRSARQSETPKATSRKHHKKVPKSNLTCSEKWAGWHASEVSNRAERRVRKMRLLQQYEATLGKKRRKIGAAYGKRRKKSSNRISNERAKKKDRGRRRQRQMNERNQWRLH